MQLSNFQFLIIHLL